MSPTGASAVVRAAEDPEAPSTPEEIAKRRIERKILAQYAFPSDESSHLYTASYSSIVGLMIAVEDFKSIEDEANRNLQAKAKVPGGAFKQFWLYEGVFPQITHGGNSTPDEWRQFFVRLRHWREEYPQSETARLATAAGYIKWAWAARGAGYSDRVTEAGANLFQERTEHARQILEADEKTGIRDPEHFYLMMRVALAAGWSPEDTTKLVARALKFDNTYYPTFQRFAEYLAPRWYGSTDAPAAGAKAVADKVGGKLGDYLYFTMATMTHCECANNDEFKAMDWDRIKRGFAAGEELYGLSYLKLNDFAKMAVAEGDRAAARQAFDRLGQHLYEWNPSKLNSSRAWAYDVAVSELPD